MSSKKTAVIAYLFQTRLLPDGSFDASRSVVTLAEVSDAITVVHTAAIAAGDTRQSLSNNNPANFWKDFIRNLDSARRNWPATVLAAGYAATSAKGVLNGCFEFVPHGPTDPLFPSDYTITPELRAAALMVQSLSLTEMFRDLPSGGENRVVSVMARLNVLEHHFAGTRAPDAPVVATLEFLQNSVKLQPGEVDALWSAKVKNDAGDAEVWLVGGEVKTGRDDILDEQVLDWTRALLSSSRFRERARGVIPVAVKAFDGSELLVVEYAAVSMATPPDDLKAVTPVCQRLIILRPPVEGL